MSETRTLELIALADRAKSHGEYKLANAIFAILLDHYLFHVTEPEEGEPPEMWLLWETSDPGGDLPLETYYDLLVIGAYDNGAIHLNCPVPLLSLRAAVTALKSAEKVERDAHLRAHLDTTPEERESLWNELFSLIPEDKMMFLIQRHLACDACVSIMKRNLTVRENKLFFTNGEMEEEICSISDPAFGPDGESYMSIEEAFKGECLWLDNHKTPRHT